MIELLQDYTIQNVVMGATLLGIISGVLGSFAVLRQQSLLGDTLSHAALPGVCLGFMIAGTRDLASIMGGALFTGILAALAVVVITRRSRLKTDAALGITLSVFFAIGVVLLTYIQNSGNASQGGLDSFLFGQAAAILRQDIWVMAGITILALGIIAALWKELKVTVFDPDFAASLGLPVATLETLLTVMIALAVVVGLQMVGVVLMASMVIAPATAARQWHDRLGPMVISAALIGVSAGVAGALVSALGEGLATGPLIVLGAAVLVAISLLFAPRRGLVRELLDRWRGRRQLEGHQVLTTLYGLARRHRDPSFMAERGFVDAYHGLRTRRALEQLQAQGFVDRFRAGPDEAEYWELTDSGVAEAERILADMKVKTT
jgi:manganese/zinc/iron transport system permease protein